MTNPAVIAYEGRTDSTGACQVDRVHADGATPLDPRRDLRNHSPSGFGWGYGGSGPAQLALALLADHLRDRPRALGLYHDFKHLVVARLDHESGWRLTPADLDEAIRTIEAGCAREGRG